MFLKIKILSGYNINRYVEDLCNFQDGVDVSAGSCCKVMGRTALTPAGNELSCTAGEASSHVGIAEGQDLTFFVDTFSNNELEVAIAVLGDCQISNRASVRIELSQVSAAGLAVEDRSDR